MARLKLKVKMQRGDPYHLHQTYNPYMGTLITADRAKLTTLEELDSRNNDESEQASRNVGSKDGIESLKPRVQRYRPKKSMSIYEDTPGKLSVNRDLSEGIMNPSELELKHNRIVDSEGSNTPSPVNRMMDRYQHELMADFTDAVKNTENRSGSGPILGADHSKFDTARKVEVKLKSLNFEVPVMERDMTSPSIEDQNILEVQIDKDNDDRKSKNSNQNDNINARLLMKRIRNYSNSKNKEARSSKNQIQEREISPRVIENQIIKLNIVDNSVNIHLGKGRSRERLGFVKSRESPRLASTSLSKRVEKPIYEGDLCGSLSLSRQAILKSGKYDFKQLAQIFNPVKISSEKRTKNSVSVSNNKKMLRDIIKSKSPSQKDMFVSNYSTGNIKYMALSKSKLKSSKNTSSTTQLGEVVRKELNSQIRKSQLHSRKRKPISSNTHLSSTYVYPSIKSIHKLSRLNSSNCLKAKIVEQELLRMTTAYTYSRSQQLLNKIDAIEKDRSLSAANKSRNQSKQSIKRSVDKSLTDHIGKANPWLKINRKEMPVKAEKMTGHKSIKAGSATSKLSSMVANKLVRLNSEQMQKKGVLQAEAVVKKKERIFSSAESVESFILVSYW